MQIAQHSTFQSTILEELLLFRVGIGAPVVTGTNFPFASAGPAPQIRGVQAFGLQLYKPIYIIDDHHFVIQQFSISIVFKIDICHWVLMPLLGFYCFLKLFYL